MVSIEYIKFRSRKVDLLHPHHGDPDCCKKECLFCRNDDNGHYHVESEKFFTMQGDSAAEYDHMYGCADHNILEVALAAINDLCITDDYHDFVLAFLLESDGYGEFDYELLGVVVQDGYNLVVKPWSNNNAADCTSRTNES